MNFKITKIAHQLLFWCATIVIITGLMRVLHLSGTISNNIHRFSGMILVLLFFFHMYIHRKILMNVIFSPKK